MRRRWPGRSRQHVTPHQQVLWVLVETRVGNSLGFSNCQFQKLCRISPFSGNPGGRGTWKTYNQMLQQEGETTWRFASHLRLKSQPCSLESRVSAGDWLVTGKAQYEKIYSKLNNQLLRKHTAEAKVTAMQDRGMGRRMARDYSEITTFLVLSQRAQFKALQLQQYRCLGVAKFDVKKLSAQEVDLMSHVTLDQSFEQTVS